MDLEDPFFPEWSIHRTKPDSILGRKTEAIIQILKLKEGEFLTRYTFRVSLQQTSSDFQLHISIL